MSERMDRKRAEREKRIVTRARAIAESEGWDAVTVRRLADEIGYSQPVLYSHFTNRDAIVAEVAVEGFRDIRAVLVAAARKASDERNALERAAAAYLKFSFQNPACYQAMFVLPTRLRFAQADTRRELKEAFVALAAVVEPFCADVEVATETFWAALHGLTELEWSGRIRARARVERLKLVVQAVVGLQDRA